MIRPGSATALQRALGSQSTLTLWAEYDDAICRAQAPEARAWRERMGWPRRATLMGLGGGVARIIPHAHGLYTPAEDGPTAAILVPCWDGPAPGRPENLIDLLAWCPTSGNIYTRRGLVDVLGEEAVRRSEPCMGISMPLTIYPDPGAWAQAADWEDEGAHGVVILDWSRARSMLGHLIGVCEFIVPDVATGQRLRAALQAPASKKPRILVQHSQQGAA